MLGGVLDRGVGTFDDALRRPRRQVANALADFVRHSTSEKAERTLNVRGPLLKRAVSAAKQVANHRAPLLPAWQRFDGVVWKHLDPATLTPDERARILVPSGLYGVSTSDDLIADFRLRMNVRLPAIGNVATFWRTRLIAAMAPAVDGATIVNLLPKEHDAALDLVGLGAIATVINVNFTHGDGAAAAGHDAKAVKGVLARSLVDSGADVLASFEWAGWRASAGADGVVIAGP